MKRSDSRRTKSALRLPPIAALISRNRGADPMTLRRAFLGLLLLGGLAASPYLASAEQPPPPGPDSKIQRARVHSLEVPARLDGERRPFPPRVLRHSAHARPDLAGRQNEHPLRRRRHSVLFGPESIPFAGGRTLRPRRPGPADRRKVPLGHRISRNSTPFSASFVFARNWSRKPPAANPRCTITCRPARHRHRNPRAAR